jgi:hypothetical protein
MNTASRGATSGRAVTEIGGARPGLSRTGEGTFGKPVALHSTSPTGPSCHRYNLLKVSPTPTRAAAVPLRRPWPAIIRDQSRLPTPASRRLTP